MPAYDYKCDDCGNVERVHDTHDGALKAQLDQNATPCTCGGTYHRQFGFSLAPVMQEHYNYSVGKPISSMRQFRDELKKQGEAVEERTGIASTFEPADWTEQMQRSLEVHGDDGLQTQHDAAVARGEKEPVGRMVY